MSRWWSHRRTPEAAPVPGNLKAFPPRPLGTRTSHRLSRYGEGGMSAIEVWRQRVAMHQAQSQEARAAQGIAEGDRWEAVSSLFKANPHRTDDVEVNRLARWLTPAMTVLDVGGGAGRFAL